MPSFKAIIQNLDTTRKAEFAVLEAKDESERSAGESERLKMAPIESDTLFLTPFGEPFYDTVYHSLQARQTSQHRPAIHLGFAGTRNLSIAGTTKADAVILADYNLNEQALLETLGEVAHALDAEKGAGNYGPEDFVKAFSSHVRAQTLLRKVPPANHRHSTIPTDLTVELTVPESWLYENQQDGRFQHIMKLFREEKVATIALNIADTEGFTQLADTLQDVRREIPALHNAEISSVFLSNLLFFLASSSPFQEQDNTPRHTVGKALENIRTVAPDDPYVVFAKKRVVELQENPQNVFLKNPRFATPDYEAVSQVVDTEIHETWQQVTMGAHLSDMLDPASLLELEAPPTQRFLTTTVNAGPFTSRVSLKKQPGISARRA